MTDADVKYCRTLAYVVCRSWNSLDLIDDAAQEACVAFLICEQRFDPDRGYSMGYAAERIKGAVKDYLRWTLRKNGPLVPLQLKARTGLEDDECEIDRTPVVEPHGTAGIEADRLLEHLVARPRELYVICQRFWQDRTQLEVGAMLGVNTSRVSQLERTAIGRMRGAAHMGPSPSCATRG